MGKTLISAIGWILLIALAACSIRSSETGTPVSKPVDGVLQDSVSSPETGEKDLAATPGGESTETESVWDDRTIFLTSLNQAGQQSLDDLPRATVYHLSLEIPEDLSAPLLGTMEVRYFNQERNALSEIYFRLFPNYYGGQLQVEDVTVDGRPAMTSLESDGTALRVTLGKPLNPGWSVVIGMNFRLLLPATMGGNYGLLGFFENVLVLDTFYPMIPAYDQKGWSNQFPYENGDLTYNDASFYRVEVTAPEDLMLAASGSVVDEKEGEGVQIVTFAAGPARDFYLAGSTEFTVISEEVDGITVNSYALDGYREHQEFALEDAVEAIETFNDLIGPYPYREFDVISSPMLALGIEYPGITGIFWQLYRENDSTRGVANQAMLESVIVHEAAHQWFYNAVGNDQQNQPWLDEALVQYLVYVFYLQHYGEATAQVFPASWEQRLSGVEDRSLPVGLSAGAYSREEYSGIVYGKGPMFFQALEKQVGRQVLWEAIADYYQTHLWEVANPQDLQTSLENGCGCDLSQLFDVWVFSEDAD